jgi:ACT domain-containing protein
MKYALIIHGDDRVGLIAEIASFITKKNANIYSVEQTIDDNIFKMIMYFETGNNNNEINELSKLFKLEGEKLKLNIVTVEESEFNTINFL